MDIVQTLKNTFFSASRIKGDSFRIFLIILEKKLRNTQNLQNNRGRERECALIRLMESPKMSDKDESHTENTAVAAIHSANSLSFLFSHDKQQ